MGNRPRLGTRKMAVPCSIPEKKLFPWQCEASRLDGQPPRVHPNSLGPFVFLAEPLRSAAQARELESPS